VCKISTKIFLHEYSGSVSDFLLFIMFFQLFLLLFLFKLTGSHDKEGHIDLIFFTLLRFLMKSAKSLKKQKRYLEMAWRWACFLSFKTSENDRWPTAAHRYLPVTTKWFFFTKPAQAPKISAGIEREGAQSGNAMNCACATSQSKLEMFRQVWIRHIQNSVD